MSEIEREDRTSSVVFSAACRRRRIGSKSGSDLVSSPIGISRPLSGSDPMSVKAKS